MAEATKQESIAPGSTAEPTASALFADFVVQREGRGGAEFEALLTAHAALRGDLLRLRKEWDDAQELLGRLAPGASLARSLRGAGSSSVPAKVAVEVENLLARFRSRVGLSARYRPVEEIARGGMGTVLRVWDESLHRALAMKVMLDGPAGETSDTPASRDPRFLARFLEEAQITGQLDHPGIVPVHELGVDEQNRAFFTMKLVRGQTLHEVVSMVHRAAEGWTLTRALGVLLRVCEAMAYAHAKGVIHRDLKPANVMIGRFGEVYVMDWGLARILGGEEHRDPRVRQEHVRPETIEIRSDRREHVLDTPDSPLVTMDGDIVGTPSYMSPEQAEGALEALGPRSDVYAVGAMLYHLLTGQVPYMRTDKPNTPRALWARLLAGPPASIAALARDVPEELVAICEKAMAREPERRYADMAELAEDLRSYLEGRVVRAHRTGALVELSKWMRRNPIASRLAAVAMLASLALVGVGTKLATSWDEVRAGKAQRSRALREGLLEEGFLALGDGEPLAAMPSFERALAQDPGSVEALAGLAMSRLSADAPTAAFAVLDAHPELRSAHPELERLELAITRADLRARGPEAVDAQYGPRFAADPRDIRALVAVACAKFGSGDSDEALALIGSDWEFIAEHPALGFLRLEILRRMDGSVAESMAEWQRQHLPAPKGGLACYLAGLHYLTEEQSYGDALDQLVNAVLQSSEARPLYYFTALRAAALSRDSIWNWRKGRTDSDSETVQKLAQAILEKWPDSEGAAENVVHAYLSCRGLDPRPILGERYDHVLRTLEEDVAADPENARALFRHARALFLHGSFDSAVTELERAITLAPDDRSLRLELVRWHHDAGRYSDAIVLYRDFLASAPEEARAWNELGALLMDVEEFQGALEAFDRCERLLGKSPTSNFDAGRALLLLGRFAEAHARFRAGQLLVEQGDASGADLPFLINIRDAENLQELVREEAALLAGERSARDHQDADFMTRYLRARGHFLPAAMVWEDFLAGVEPDGWKYNYWSAAKTAGLAVGESTSGEDRSFWRGRAIDWLMLYLRTCEQSRDYDDPNITPEVYARLLHMTQASRAFATLREPLEDEAIAIDHERCADLWQWVERELAELGR